MGQCGGASPAPPLASGPRGLGPNLPLGSRCDEGAADISIFLYGLGGLIARRRGLVLGVWLLVLVFLVGSAALLGPKYDDSFSIPGTPSQQGQDVLADRFGLTGTNGQVLYTSTSGAVTAKGPAAAVGQTVSAMDKVSGVTVSNPLTADTPLVSQDTRSTIAQVRFASKTPSETTLDAVQTGGGAARRLRARPPRSAATPTRPRPTRARCPSCWACSSRS